MGRTILPQAQAQGPAALQPGNANPISGFSRSSSNHPALYIYPDRRIKGSNLDALVSFNEMQASVQICNLAAQVLNVCNATARAPKILNILYESSSVQLLKTKPPKPPKPSNQLKLLNQLELLNILNILNPL